LDTRIRPASAVPPNNHGTVRRSQIAPPVAKAFLDSFQPRRTLALKQAHWDRELAFMKNFPHFQTQNLMVHLPAGL
jgi:hypothetical protein